jgi:tetratricopeptide (TPR) repeat protein
MKKYVLFLFIVYSSSFIALNAQNIAIDSLFSVLKTQKEDTNRVKTLNAIATDFYSVKPDSAILFAQQAINIAVKLGYTKGVADAYNNIGIAYSVRADYPKALDNYSKALKAAGEANDIRTSAAALRNMGNVYSYQSNFAKAMDCDQRALKLAEEINAKDLELGVYNSIGTIYDYQSDYGKALDYYFKALGMAEATKNMYSQGNCFGNIAAVYSDQGDHQKALEYSLKSLKFYREFGNKEAITYALANIGGEYHFLKDYDKSLEFDMEALKMAEELGSNYLKAAILGNIGDAYFEKRIYPKALDYYNEALKIDRVVGDKQVQATILDQMGTLYKLTGKFKEAEDYLKQAVVLDSSINDRNQLWQAETSLSDFYDTTGKFKPALDWYKKARVLKDTLFNVEKNKALTRKELTYEFDKKQAAQKAEQDKKDALAEADKRRQTIVIWSTIGGLLLVLVFAGFIFRSLRVTRKQKQIIEIKNIETEKQKTLIEQQKIVVEEKNKDILDSINYAKRLQDAILPPLSLIKQCLPESFVLYKPKDIVAGDFYWMEKVGDTVLIAAADCTGHGVPGALVSVVCSNALNRTVKEFKITEPGKILAKVRELVLETFEKSGEIQDGMDISLCALTFLSPKGEGVTDTNIGSSSTAATTDTSLPKGREGVRVQWAGAYNSLWYIMDGKMIEIPADKQPIGKTDNPKPFTTHTINISKSQPEADGGAVLYLFTDGYADQFGGPKGKKFKYAQFSDKLKMISHKSMEEQKNILDKTFEDWKGGLEQVDDVLVIGIRV